jgi:hypothetical protein
MSNLFYVNMTIIILNDFREKYPWCELAENAQTGAAVTFLRGVSFNYFQWGLFAS